MGTSSRVWDEAVVWFLYHLLNLSTHIIEIQGGSGVLGRIDIH